MNVSTLEVVETSLSMEKSYECACEKAVLINRQMMIFVHKICVKSTLETLLMQADLDAMDLTLLRALQEHPDASASEIADAVNLSQSACWRRMARLRDAGVIKRRAYVLDRRALGYGIVAFVRVKLGSYSTDALQRFERAAAALPHVQELQLISAENAYRLRVVARSMEDYEYLFRHSIATLPGVKDVLASLVVSEIKYTTDLPLTEALLAAKT